jgi:hypothetical protein
MSYEDQVRNEYFEWLYNYVCKGRVNNRISYKKLFILLHDIDFDFYIRSDMNRAIDGTDLRYRFSIVKDDDSINDILDGPCSVLEMMVALAVRAETIMDNPKYGDRTGQWFWGMLSNLGLNRMTDDNFNEKIATQRIYDFLERRYNPNGKGGLFYIPETKEDLTQVEIWTQMCWYLDKFN